jgi:hypothetical protein
MTDQYSGVVIVTLSVLWILVTAAAIGLKDRIVNTQFDKRQAGRQQWLRDQVEQAEVLDAHHQHILGPNILKYN